MQYFYSFCEIPNLSDICLFLLLLNSFLLLTKEILLLKDIRKISDYELIKVVFFLIAGNSVFCILSFLGSVNKISNLFLLFAKLFKISTVFGYGSFTSFLVLSLFSFLSSCISPLKGINNFSFDSILVDSMLIVRFKFDESGSVPTTISDSHVYPVLRSFGRKSLINQSYNSTSFMIKLLLFPYCDELGAEA
jgi:hypothetical protein